MSADPGSVAQPAAVRQPVGGLWQALWHRDFRLIWTTNLLFHATRWMETVVVAWLVLEITDSPFMVGVVAACRSAGWFLGPLGGLLADRLNRSRLLALIQAVNLLQASVFLALLGLGRLQLWEVLSLSLVSGALYALDFPTRFSLVADLVKPGRLTSAVSLLRVAQDVTTAIGPVVGGSMVALFSVTGAYVLIVALHAFDLVARLLITSQPKVAVVPGKSVWGDLKGAFSVLQWNSLARLILVLAFLANLFGFPFLHALLPVFAREVLRIGPAGLGLLMAAPAVGSLLGSIGLASRGQAGRRGAIAMVGFLLWPVVQLAFSLSGGLALSLVLLLGVGAAQSLSMNATHALLLSAVPPDLRGRVMGARGLAILSQPGGSILLGAGAAAVGAPLALAVNAVAFGAVMVTLAAVRPTLRRAD